MFGYDQQQYQQFQNPYLSRLMQVQPPQPQRYEITRVNGRNGAEAFQMPPNSSILLLDESQPIVWLRQTDGAGYATTTPYQISPYQTRPEPDFGSLEARIQRLEEMIHEPDSSGVKQSDGRGANVPTKPDANASAIR